MRSVSVIALCVALLAMASVSVFAETGLVSVWGEEAASITPISSWIGSTGLIYTPSVSTLGAGAVSASYHRVSTDADDIDVVGVNFGITKDLEVGATRMDVPGADAENMGQAKYHIDLPALFKNSRYPQGVIGVWDVTNQVNRAWYVAIGKTFALTPVSGGPNISLTAGFAGNDLGEGPLDGFFAGAELQAFKYGRIQAEYDGENFNAALRYSPSRRLSLDLGSLDGDFGYGLTYQSGF